MPIVVNGAFKPSDPFGLYHNRANPLSPVAADVAADPDAPSGLLARGNIDLDNRPVTFNDDGSFSTVDSISFEDNGVEVLVPTIAPDGRRLSPDEAVEHYRRTGENLGKFRDAASADAYAEKLHEAQARQYGPKAQQLRQQQRYQQLEQSDPGRYQLVDADKFEAWHKDWQAKQPGFIEDALRQLIGGAYKGTGAAVRGVGEAVAVLGDKTTTPVINAIFGTNYTTHNLAGGAADALEGYGTNMQAGISAATRQAIAESSPNGDVLNPSTWSLGEKPSLAGYTALALDVFGQMAPVLAASIAAGPLAGASAGGAQGGGAAVEQAGQLIDQMAAQPGVLESQSAYFREQLAAGKSREEALAATKEAAGRAAFVLTAPISGAGGYATGRIINPAESILAGKHIVARILGRAGLSGAEEGTQEAAEDVATTGGVNVGAGANLDVTQGTFADFLLGALAGAPAGGIAGGLSREGAPEPAGLGEPTAELVEPQTAPPQAETMPAPKPGPLAAARDYGLSKAAPGPAFIVNDPPLPGYGAGPEHGQTVSLAADQAGLDPAMRRVTMADGTEGVLPSRLLQPLDGGEAPDPQATEAPAEVQTGVPGLPPAGSNIIASPPGMEKFTGKIEQYVETPEGTEAIVADKNGEVFQLPVQYLRSLRLTEQMMADMDREESPPIERTAVPEDATTRIVGGQPIRFPDATLARLYDIGRERRQSQLLSGKSNLDMRGRGYSPEDATRIADELGVLPERIDTIADDYRHRAERAAKRGGSGLPINMHGLNSERLKGWQAERANGALTEDDPVSSAEKPASSDGNAEADGLAAWWNGLQPGARKALLAAAGVKRSEKSTWDKFSAGIRKRLAPFRDQVKHGADAATDRLGEALAADDQQFDGLQTEDEVRRAAAALADESHYPDRADYIAERAVERWKTRKLEREAHRAATSPQNDTPEPTDGQQKAGNYKMGHVKLGGLDISIENPAGSERSGTDRRGKPWSVTMKSHYGYIRGTIGKDKDHLDVFVAPGTEEIADDAPVFVVDQANPGGRFDEHKVMLGFRNMGDAYAGYLENYAPGWKGLKDITPTTLADFKRWLADGDTTKPFARRADGKAEIADADAPVADNNPAKTDKSPFDTIHDLPARLERLLRTANIFDDMAGIVRAGAANKELLDKWAATIGVDRTSVSANRIMLTAMPRGLEVVMPAPDRKRTARKVYRGKDLAELIRSAVADVKAPESEASVAEANEPVAQPGESGSDEIVEQRLTAKGPWDFNDTYPAPDPEKLARLDREGRVSFDERNDDSSVDAMQVASTLEEALQELQVRHLDIEAARQALADIDAGRTKLARKNPEKERRRLAESIHQDEQAIEDLGAAYLDLFDEPAVDALLAEGRRRAGVEMRQTDPAVERPRIPKEERPDEDWRNDPRHVANREAAKAFKKGDRVEWTNENFDPPRIFTGTIKQKQFAGFKDLGVLEVAADGDRPGGARDVSIGASQLRPMGHNSPPPASREEVGKPQSPSDNEVPTLAEVQRIANTFADPLAVVQRFIQDPETVGQQFEDLRLGARKVERAIMRKYGAKKIDQLDDTNLTEAERHFIFYSDGPTDREGLAELSEVLEPIVDAHEAATELRRVMRALPEETDYDAMDHTGKLAVARLFFLGNEMSRLGLDPEKSVMDAARAIAGQYDYVDDAEFMVRTTLDRLKPFIGGRNSTATNEEAARIAKVYETDGEQAGRRALGRAIAMAGTNSGAGVDGRALGEKVKELRALPSSESDVVATKTSAGGRERIEDFGEELHGARKHLAQTYHKALSDEVDVTAEPLSVSFPRPNYVKLADEGVSGEALALIAVMRDSIPNKPRKGYKLRRWAEQVDKARTLAAELFAGNDVEAVSDSLPNDLWLTAQAIAGLPADQIEAAARWRIGSGSYSLFMGQRFSPPKTLYYAVDADGRIAASRAGTENAAAYDESREGIVAKTRALIAADLSREKPQKAKARQTNIHVYRDSFTREYFVGFKGRSTVLRLKAGFSSGAEARAYIDQNGPDLQAKIEEMRRGPIMRNVENRERSGQRLRDGDISPDDFSDAFGFRGVQFGNYVEGGRRQADLNRAYDALMDLADAVGVPPRALSLDGSLGLAFGARGHGGRNAAAAHYEPGTVVINLTKNAGPGSLAHEWLHALDNYFARQDGGHGFMSERRRPEGKVREPVYQAWRAVEAAVKQGKFLARAVKADETRSKPYWSQTIELAARAFERYIVDRLETRGVVNDYLANINLAGGAYPTEEEMNAGIRAAYDGLFDTIEHEETDNGNVRLYSRRSGDSEPVAELSGHELIDFTGPQDIPALRRAARDWYDDNLRGTTARTRDGREVRFTRRGRGKVTSSAKGDLLLRTIPAISAIVENGEQVFAEPGNRPGVAERIVISAPVKIEGVTRQLAVSIHRNDDGHYHYDLTFDRDVGPLGVAIENDGKNAESEKPRVTRGGRKLSQPLASLEVPQFTPGNLNIVEWPAARNDAVANVRQQLRAGGMGRIADHLEQNGRLTIATAASVGADSETQGWTDPDGSITLLADNIPHGEAASVLLHEAFHAGARPLLGDQNWRQLMLRLAGLYRQFEGSNGRAREFFDAARSRVRSAEASAGRLTEPLAVEEFGAYAIEEYASAPAALRKWVDDVLGAIKAWALRRFGRQIGPITPAQLSSIAQTALRDAMGEPGVQAASRRRSIASVGAGIATPTISREAATRWLKGKWVDLQPSRLALVPLNYFSELRQPNMVAVDHYLKTERAMRAYRGKKHAAMDEIAQEWRKYAALGFGPDAKAGKTRAATLADLMHDSTLAGIDPSLTDEETKAKAGYENLRARYTAMPARGRQLFNKVRDSYKEQADELDRILLDNVRKTQEVAFRRADDAYRKELRRIKEAGLTGLDKSKAEHDAQQTYEAEMQRATYAMKARMTRMRIAFEASRVPAPYFPLARFGNYFVAVKNPAGEVLSFSKRETKAEIDALAAQMRKAYPNDKVTVGAVSEREGTIDAMDPRIVAEIDAILGKADIDATIRDAIYQRYLESMPDLSMRKRFIHRKGTAGFGGDALRTFASHHFHAAHQMGRLKYGIDLQELVRQTVDQANEAPDQIAGMRLANELKRRHSWIMNPTGSRAAQAITSSMFVWHLAASPAAAVVNLSQTPMLGVPILGARYGGLVGASAALVRASGDVLRGRGSALRGGVTADERRALEAFYDSGLIEKTQSHDLAGVGETGVRYSPLRQQVMQVISWMFHNAEVLNREVTALAAYRLAREQGEHELAAIDAAHEMVHKIHFDYGNSARARVMQGDLAKVALVFQNYQLNMWYRLMRDTQQSFRGATPQARREARYQLAGVIGMMTLFGGVSGVFGYNVLMALAGMIFDDDDDPRSFKAEMEGHVLDLFGKDIGGMILRGVPGHLARIDLTSRLGMPDLFIRMPDHGEEGRDWYEELVLATMGASASTFISMGDGLSLVMQGNVMRGVETAAPKPIKDLMQAYRYANEGITTRKGDTILERSQIDPWDYIAEVLGFTSAKVTETYERIDTLKEAEQRVIDERRGLINAFATAVIMHDDEGRARALERIKAWNRKPYARTMPITGKGLSQSLTTRQRNAAKREDGAFIADPELSRYLRNEMPVAVYR